jgi:hypothetical protein
MAALEERARILDGMGEYWPSVFVSVFYCRFSMNDAVPEGFPFSYLHYDFGIPFAFFETFEIIVGS